MDLVSVIVPVYKVEEYIHECINSIINQSYSNLEIILIDDGSPDKCGEICDNYATSDSRVKVIHKINGGLSDARNAGLDIATGEYIVFVDSDDYIDVDMISTLHKRIRESKADMAICTYLFVDENDSPIIEKNSCLPQIDRLYTGIQVLRGVTEKEGIYFVTVWNKMYRSELWESLRFPVGKQHEDEYVLHELCLKCNIVVGVSRSLYYYRQRRDSIMSSKYDVKRLDAIEALFIRANALHNIGEYELFEIFNTWALSYLEQAYYILDKKQSVNANRLNYLMRYFRENFIELVKHNKSVKKLAFYIISYFSPYRAFRIKRNVHKLKNYAIFILDLLKYRFNIIKKKYVLLDTPVHGNLGDHAIAIAEKVFLENLGIECAEATAVQINNHESFYAKLTPKNKIILIHGGGFLGELWKNEEERFRRILRGFAENKIIVFPQTVTFSLKTNEDIAFFEKSKKDYLSHNKLMLFVREKNSYEFLNKYMKEVSVKLLPDMVLSFIPKIESLERQNILLCFRRDKEKNLNNISLDSIYEVIKIMYPLIDIKITDTVIEKLINPQDRYSEVHKKLKEFSAAKLIVTDRLHGMIFAAITNTPCIAFSNLNGKVKGVYEWIKENEYICYVENLSEFEKALNNIDLNKKYCFKKYNMDRNFDLLREFIKGE